MRGSKFPADMHNYIWCPIYIPSFMIIGSVVSEELRWQDFGTDGRTDGRSDCTPRPAFAFGDAGKNRSNRYTESRGVFFCYVEEERKIFHSVSLIMKDLAKTFSLFPWRRYIRRKSHVIQNGWQVLFAFVRQMWFRDREYKPADFYETSITGWKKRFPKNGNLLETTRNRDISSFPVVSIFGKPLCGFH